MTATEVILNQTVAINNSLNDISHILRQAQQVVAPINLDLGGALAAAGLMFTVYQLGKPEWNVVFKIRNFFERWSFLLLSCLGLFFSFVRATYPASYPLNFELLSYFSFILAPIALVYYGSHSGKLFNTRNSLRFYKVVESEMTKSNHGPVLEVILDNFEEICEAINSYDNSAQINANARKILDLLGDDSFVKVLTTQRLDSLLKIFRTVEKYNLSSRDTVGISMILKGLFTREDSFFYKQLGGNGSALTSNIYDLIFKSPTLLNKLNPFVYPTLNYSDRKDTTKSIDVLIKCLTMAIERYFKYGEYSAHNINPGLSHLSDIFGMICTKISAAESRGVDTKYVMKEDWNNLRKIGHFFGKDYLIFTNTEKLEISKEIIAIEFVTSEATFYSATISGGISASIYSSFEDLSYISNNDEDLYYLVLSLLDGVMHGNTLALGVREPFEKIIWQKIGENIVHKHYPAVLRPYLTFIGFCAANTDSRGGWSGEQATKMVRLLYVDLKPHLEKNDVMINKKLMKEALLPSMVNYKEGVFSYIMSGQGPEVVIEPPKDTTSALVDFDPKEYVSVA